VQQSRLADLGCTFGQGYLFSPPLDPQKADELLREQSLHLAFREESFPVL